MRGRVAEEGWEKVGWEDRGVLGEMRRVGRKGRK